jgi:hypothetical protein
MILDIRTLLTAGADEKAYASRLGYTARGQNINHKTAQH